MLPTVISLVTDSKKSRKKHEYFHHGHRIQYQKIYELRQKDTMPNQGRKIRLDCAKSE